MKLKGHLRPLLLKLLSPDRGMTGSELVDEIEEQTGSRPSYGSIYPLLKEFREEGLVRTERDGRKKIYRLTEKGMESYEKVLETKEKVLDTVMKVFRTYDTVFGTDSADEVSESIKERSKSRDIRFPELFDLVEILLTTELSERDENMVKEKLSEILDLIDD